MAGTQGHTYLAVGLEAANAGAMARARDVLAAMVAEQIGANSLPDGRRRQSTPALRRQTSAISSAFVIAANCAASGSFNW